MHNKKNGKIKKIHSEEERTFRIIKSKGHEKTNWTVEVGYGNEQITDVRIDVTSPSSIRQKLYALQNA